MRIGSLELSDEEFVRALTDLTLRAEAFGHGDHLRLGWILLERLGLKCATARAAELIRRFAAHHGKADLYHATITRGWMTLLASHGEEDFQQFLQRNAARLTRELLHEYWRPQTLYGEAARARWVSPDIRALPEPAPRIRP